MNQGTSQPNGHASAGEMTLGASSHIGRRRVANEDAFCILAGIDAPLGALVCAAVADGMGGHKAGEVASSLAIKELTRLVAHHRFEHSDESSAGLPSALADDVQLVNREVYRASMVPDLLGMGTTLTAGVIVESTLHLAHVGDSRAYLFRNGYLQRLTKDHSWAEEQVAAGLLSADEAVSHPGRNVLTRALGVAPAVQVDAIKVALLERDVVLLCSDGLYTQVKEVEIIEILSKERPQKACERLVESANRQGGRDNITALVIRLDQLDGSGGRRAASAEHSHDGMGGGLRGMWSRLSKAMRPEKS